MTNKEAISNLERIYGVVSPDIQISLDIAIKALEEKVDPHYDECDYCKYNDSSDDYPCSECKYRSKWEAIE
jgi:tRNA(Ile2) C34 agmatinyltransferase TiaS